VRPITPGSIVALGADKRLRELVFASPSFCERTGTKVMTLEPTGSAWASTMSWDPGRITMTEPAPVERDGARGGRA